MSSSLAESVNAMKTFDFSVENIIKIDIKCPNVVINLAHNT